MSESDDGQLVGKKMTDRERKCRLEPLPSSRRVASNRAAPLSENDGWSWTSVVGFFVVTRGKGELIEKTNEGCQLSRT